MERIFSYLYKKQINFSQTSLDRILISVAGKEALKYYHPSIIGFVITQMHLDGFNYDILIGFERQGKQHYVRVPKWQKIVEDFERQVLIDEFKKEFNEKYSILLIVVGYKWHNGEWYRIEP